MNFFLDQFYSTDDMKFGRNSVEVEICDSTSNECKDCGKNYEVPLDSWTTVFCDTAAGVGGNQIKVSLTLLLPCEIEVYGIIEDTH